MSLVVTSTINFTGFIENIINGADILLILRYRLLIFYLFHLIIRVDSFIFCNTKIV